ncbi:MAG TPA: GNAT family N-acetyltransferase [Planctomycetota bacterium]|nr:GNAT family N-acetyltransferase [Planctomycetota bacterium]
MGGGNRAGNGGAAIGPLERAQVPALLVAWNEAFGAGRADFIPRTVADWEARFAGGPLSIRSMLARDGNRILCQYAADPQRARLHGAEVTFAQVLDTFVAPELRGGLAGARLLVRTARAFFDRYGAGQGAQGGDGGDVLYYGWPVPAARRLGVAQLDYTLTDRLLLLGREVAGVPDPPAGAGSARWGAAECVDLVTDELFEACATAWEACLVRDSSWFRRRFLKRTGADYRILGVGEPRAPQALAVLRHGDWPLANTVAIVDWLVPEGESEAGELLLGEAHSLARELGADALVTLFPPWSPWFERFQGAGYRVHATDLFLVTRPFLRRLEPLWLRDNLWLQLSDTDLL